MDSMKDDESEKGIMLALDKNGVAHQVFEMGIFFYSEQEMKAFDSWMKAKGAAEFDTWFKGMEKLRGTECENCKWRDPTQFQCYDGHAQAIGPCEGFEEDEI
jgi:hypothetical protein